MRCASYACYTSTIWATVCRSKEQVKTITVCQAFVMNSERRAAESSEQRETRLARRRVADRARYAANSRRRAAESSEERETRLARRRVADRAIGMLQICAVWRIELQIQTGEQCVVESVTESVALLKALSRGRRD